MASWTCWYWPDHTSAARTARARRWGQLADEWFEDGKLTRGWTERTVSTYEHEIESLKAFHAVRAVDLERMIAGE